MRIFRAWDGDSSSTVELRWRRWGGGKGKEERRGNGGDVWYGGVWLVEEREVKCDDA